MKKYSAIMTIICTVVLLAGCMYPAQQQSANELAYEEQIAIVQGAVDQFQEDSGGLLPIKTTEVDTPIYRKYQIDFSKLKPRYLSELPGNSYENGGVFQYTIINVEEDPTVRIFDLRIAETIRSLNIRIQANNGIPFKGSLATNIYSIDYEKLGYKEDPTVLSPFTNKELPLIVTGDGTIYVDYITDLYEITQKREIVLQQSDNDLREILLKDSFFVPAYSLPYSVNEENEIVYSIQN